jgi:hypothetical protein
LGLVGAGFPGAGKKKKKPAPALNAAGQPENATQYKTPAILKTSKATTTTKNTHTKGGDFLNSPNLEAPNRTPSLRSIPIFHRSIDRSIDPLTALDSPPTLDRSPNPIGLFDSRHQLTRCRSARCALIGPFNSMVIELTIISYLLLSGPIPIVSSIK